MNFTPSHWQDVLEPQFVRRLTRPLWQPGITNNQLAKTILGRSDRFHNRLSLLTQQMQRWGQRTMLQGEQVPIVYAQVISNENAIASTHPASSPQFSTLEFASPVVIPEPPAIPSSLEASDQGREEFSNRSPDNSPVIPTVTSQPAASGLGTSGEMPLQAKFYDSPFPIQAKLDNSQSATSEVTRQSQSTASPHSQSIHNENAIAPADSDFRSTSSERAIAPTQPDSSPQLSALDNPSDLPPDLPIVTPNPVASAFDTAGAMPLQAMLDESSSAVSNVTGHSHSSSLPDSLPLPNPPPIASTASPDSPSVLDSVTNEHAIDSVHPAVPAVITTDSSSPDDPEMPVVTPNVVPSAFDTAGAMPLQAKLETPQPSIPGVTQPSQSATSPTPRPITPNTSEVAVTSAQSVTSPQLPLEFIASEKTLQTPAISSSLIRITEQIREKSPNRSPDNSPAIPIVTARPTLSGFANSGGLPLQMNFENFPVRLSSTSFASHDTAEITSNTNILPIVSAHPITLPDIRISEFDAANDMVVQAKWNHAQSTTVSPIPDTTHPAGVFEARLPIVKPTLSSSPSIIQETEETAHPPNSLPLVPAQPFLPSQALAPLLFSTSRAGDDRQERSQSTSPPQTVTSHRENGFSRIQETTVSSLGLSSSTYSSPFAETQVNQTAASPQSQAVDLEAMAAKVERRLLRRLVVESERRGQNRWGLRN